MPNASDFPPTNQLQDAKSSGGNIVTQAIAISFMTFASAVGLIGNAMVIGTICGKRIMRTSCNVFLANIAIADLLVAILLIPLRMTEQFVGWPLGEFLCQFFAPLQDVIVCVSVVTHTIIALERYRVIVTPLKVKLSLRKAKLVMIVIWGACYLATGLPLVMVLNQQDRRGKKHCIASWPSILYRRIYEVYLVTFFIVLPLFIQTTLYCKVVGAIRREGVTGKWLSRHGTDEQRRTRTHKRVRLVKMLIILVAVFQLSYIPRGTFMLLYEFTSEEYKTKHMDGISTAQVFTIIVYYLKHAVNPLILFTMSSTFRKNCCIIRGLRLTSAVYALPTGQTPGQSRAVTVRGWEIV